MKIIKNRKDNVTAGRTSGKKQFGIKAARVGKTKEKSDSINRKYSVKASSESYSMADYDIVIYRNSEKVYSGSVYDTSFYNKIRDLCKDPENLSVFKDWLLDYGVSDLEDVDISESVIDMITYEWEEATDADEDFYVEISMYGNQHSNVRFEVFYAKDEVKASTSTKRKYIVKASKKVAGSQGNDVDEDGYSAEDNERFEREQFAENIVHEIEDEYSIKVSDGAWGKIYDLADDLSFGADAHEHGSDPMWVLEDYIYEIIEEDAGIVIGSTSISASQDESLIDELWSACDDISGLQDIDFDSDDTDGTHIIFIYGNSTYDYDSRESELIEALQAAGYNAEYDTNNGSNVIVLHVTRFVNESISVRKKSVTASQVNTTVSQEDVDELVLYITNDGDLYRGRACDIIKNLKRKVKNGNYNKELAVKAWKYLADDGVRKYDKEFGSGNGSLSWLNPATRKAIAAELRDYYEEEIFYEDSVTSAVATNHNSPRTYDTDSNRDAEYLNALGKGVIQKLTQTVGDTDVFGGDVTYEISDSAITFMASGDGTVLYIQPLDHIEPNMDDLEADIEELSESIYSEIMPKF